MDPEAWKHRRCPECGSADYQFRSRKQIEAKGGQPEAVETKYRCKSCQHEWREPVEAAK
jgi:DNA-directed RNA polymerase subunit M/transcription elongation factor TFIIS